MKFISTFILFAMLGCQTKGFAMDEPLTIVTDTWPPYVIYENEQVTGTDVDITLAVFAQLKVPVKIEVLPWKRSVELVKQAKADAILGISLTEERQAFLHYPDSPISTGTTVIFTRHRANFPFTSLEQLSHKRAGAILGYSYCDELDNSVLLKQAERVSSLEQNFQKLMINRLDLLVEVDSVGYYTAKQMGISEQITVLPNARFCEGGNYLAFSKKTGHRKLSERFNSALEAFKATEGYRHILQNYGVRAD